MNSRSLPRRQLLLASLMVLLLALLFAGLPAAGPEPGGIALKAPPFVQTAHAAVPPAIAQQLDEEAGISAYFQTSGSISLSQIRGLFSTIETETSEYIIGSIPVPNYAENYHAHAYVHTSGWILAYYLNDTPVSKIVDVKAQTIDTTLLESVVAAVAGGAGQAFSSASYYDFRYPNATHMMFVAEKYDSDGREFTIELPSSYGYLERSWALLNLGSYSDFIIDGVDKISSATYWNGSTGYGYITAAELSVDTQHIISVDDYGVLVVVYSAS